MKRFECFAMESSRHSEFRFEVNYDCHLLGLNAYHGDSSAAIVVNGKLIAAVEEERFRRIKHWAGFPSLSIEYCLKEAGVSLNDVSHVAINSDPSAHMVQKVAFALKKRPDLNQIFESLQRRRKRKSIEEEFEKHFSER